MAQEDTLTVYTQDELNRVLDNLSTLDESRTLVFAQRDPNAFNRTQFTIDRPVPNPIRIDEGAHVFTEVPDMSITVNGGKLESAWTPQRNVHVEGGVAQIPRGSKARAIDGVVLIHGGNVKDDTTEITLRGKSQANSDSGVIYAYDNSYAEMSGRGKVFGYNKSRIDTFGSATFRADDTTTVRAHDSSKGHVHGSAEVYANDSRTDITWVSPTARVNATHGMKLRISDDVANHNLNKVADVLGHAGFTDAEVITNAQAHLEDSLAIARVSGANAFHQDLPAAPALNGDVQEMLRDLPVGDPVSKAIMEAYTASYREQADEAANATLTSTDTANTGNYLAYKDANGDTHYQPTSDITHVGTLIDPETGDDMEMVGWSESDGGNIRTDDMELVYTDSAGNKHTQPWQDISESGTLIDPETGDDMTLDGSSDDDFPEGYVALSDCMDDDTHGKSTDDDGYCNRCGNLTKISPDPLTVAARPTTISVADLKPGDVVNLEPLAWAAGVSDDELAGVDADYATVKDVENWGGTVMLNTDQLDLEVPSDASIDVIQEPEPFTRHDLTEKTVVIPPLHDKGESPKMIELDAIPGVRPEGTVIAQPDDTLIKVRYNKDGTPKTLQSFDWDNKQWGRSMTVVAGPGRGLLVELENLNPDRRKVPEHVAAAYGQCTGSCLMCSKPLRSDRSMTAGYGPECKGKMA